MFQKSICITSKCSRKYENILVNSLSQPSFAAKFLSAASQLRSSRSSPHDPRFDRPSRSFFSRQDSEKCSRSLVPLLINFKTGEAGILQNHNNQSYSDFKTIPFISDMVMLGRSILAGVPTTTCL